MSPSSKQRTTCRMASTLRMWPKNWLPRPSPLLAPRTRPAMSTISTTAGKTRWEAIFLRMRPRRGSGTGTMPLLGSMVQKG
jgi:hypothetical protein